MKVIVVPLDGSGRAEQALPHALAQLQRTADRLVLVRVVEPYPTSTPPPHVTRSLTEMMVADAKAYLNHVGDRLRNDGWMVQEVIRTGQTAAAIARAAHELGAEMIVATSHGRTGPSRWLLGSVAENVARRAPCPVWLLRSHPSDSEHPVALTAEPLPENPLVMVPLDGSRASEQGLDFAKKYLAARPARLLLVGATDLPSPATRGRLEVSNLLHHYLEGQVAALKQRFWEADYAVIDGPAANGILDLTAERRPALVVMASRGRTGIGRWLMGSVAERVLRHSPGPVVLVPQITGQEVAA